MSDNLRESSEQKETVTKDSITELHSSEGTSVGIPAKYLNKNVQAMIGGRLKPKPTYLLHFDRMISFFRKHYRVEVRISTNAN